MSFLTPLFLVGLAGLAMPVLLHLIQRERKNVVQFPSLMFLRRIPYQSVQRRRIRHWLLLLLRLAALALIVAGVRAAVLPARRRWRPRRAAARAKSSSCSIGRTAWATAIAGSARWPRRADAINGLSPSDRASIVFFASGAEVALRSTSDRGRLHRRGRRRAAGRRRDALRPGAEAGRQHPQRVGAAAARSDPDHRFPARRLAGRRRRAAAGRRGADAACRSATRRPPNLSRDAGVAAALDVLEAGARRRSPAGVVNHGAAASNGVELDARARRPRACRRSASTSSRTGRRR